MLPLLSFSFSGASGSSDLPEFLKTTIPSILSSAGAYIQSYLSSTAEILKGTIKLLERGPKSLKDLLVTLYGQFKQWAIVLHREWYDFKHLLDKIWETRKDTLPSLWNTMKERWSELHKIMSSINKNIEGWVSNVKLIVEETGGWATAANWLFQKKESFSSWLETIGKDWDKIKDFLEQAASEYIAIKNAKEAICDSSTKQHCKTIVESMLSTSWDSIKKEIQNLQQNGVSRTQNNQNYWQTAFNKATAEIIKHKEGWKKIISENHSKTQNIMNFLKNQGTNKLKPFFSGEKNKNLYQAWELLSGSNANNNSKFKVSSNLQSEFIKEFVSDLNKNFPKLETLLKILNAQKSNGNQVELNELMIKNLFKVKTVPALEAYGAMLSLGVPLNSDGVATAALTVANLWGTLLDKILPSSS